jgi:ribosomal protein L29
MEYKELQKKTAGQLQTLLREERTKLRESRFKDANKQLKDVRTIRATKKLIARILTALKKPAATPVSEAAAPTEPAK